MDIDITFGSDAHNIKQIGLKYNKIKKLAKKIGFKKCAIFLQRDKKMVTF